LSRLARKIVSGSTSALVAGWCVISVTPAYAADWALAFFLGDCATRSNAVRLDRPASATHVVMTPVQYDARSFDSPLYYGYRVSRYLSPRVGIEGEFIHAKTFARAAAPIRATGTVDGADVEGSAPLSSVIERFAMSHGLNFVLANVVYRQGIGADPQPRVSIAARAGAGITVPHVESTIAGVSREQYELGGVGMQVAIGAELRVTGRLHSFAEVKITHTAESVSVSAGSISGRFTTVHGIAGIAWHL